MPSPKDIFDKAYELANILNKIENLNQSINDLADTCAALNERLIRLESSLQAMKAEIRLDAVREAQQIVNSVQATFFQELMALSRKVDNAPALRHEGGAGGAEEG